MDHLVLPEGAKPWILIAYEADEASYYDKDRGNFFEYPTLKGWEEDDVRAKPRPNDNLLGGVEDGPDKKRSPMEIEVFFQTWLFFGLLIEVFALNDILVTTKDFLVPFTLRTIQRPQKSQLVTTEGLPCLIVEWMQKSGRDKSVLEQAMKIIDRVGEIVDHHCTDGKDYRSVRQYGKVLWPLKDEITTSIIAVASTLRKAVRSVYNETSKEERWPVTNSKILYLRIQRKWCKSDAAMIMEDTDIDGQYYIAAAESHSLESLDGHYACTDHSCEAKISDGTYITRHALDCKAQNDYEPELKFVGHLSPVYGTVPTSVRDAITTIMEMEDLPILRWNYEQKGLHTYGHKRHTYSEESSETPPYVAISHIWADGMGNPFDNSLPSCQLERIQRLVDDLCSSHLPGKKSCGTPGFWVDTICCIVGQDEESKRLKAMSIESMREIYHDCVAVLVIDPWLMAIPTTSPMAEIAYRIYTSGWSRRLWTHQEGFLGRDVYYQFRDGPLSLDEVAKLSLRYQRSMAQKGYPITFPHNAVSKHSFYYTGIKNIVDNIRSGHFTKSDRWMIYKHLAESLGHRSTTNVDDELLCIASITGLDVKVYTNCKSDKKGRESTAELRMQAFLKEIGRFKQGIIFNNYRRLTTPGFRWAPISLLGHRASSMGDIENSKDQIVEDYSGQSMGDRYIELETFGKKINLNLTKYLSDNLGLGQSCIVAKIENKILKFTTVGLPVDFPGYIIKFPKDSGLTINMAERRFVLKYSTRPSITAAVKLPSLPQLPPIAKVPTPKGFPSFRKTSAPVVPTVEKVPAVEPVAEVVTTYKYVVYVAENDVKWAYDRAYAIILQKPLGVPNNLEFLAMIGLKSIGPGYRKFVQSLCSAVVRLVRSDDSDKLTAGLDVVDVSEPKTEWVIT